MFPPLPPSYQMLFNAHTDRNKSPTTKCYTPRYRLCRIQSNTKTPAHKRGRRCPQTPKMENMLYIVTTSHACTLKSYPKDRSNKDFPPDFLSLLLLFPPFFSRTPTTQITASSPQTTPNPNSSLHLPVPDSPTLPTVSAATP